jgi:hypothetical protein
MHNDINDSVNELFAPSNGGVPKQSAFQINDDSFSNKHKNNIELDMS